MKYSVSFRIKSYINYIFSLIFKIIDFKLIIKFVNAYKLYKKYNTNKYIVKEADTIVWIYSPNRKLFFETIIWDILLMTYVASCKQKFMVYRKLDIGKFRNKNILFSINKDKLNLFNIENYSSIYQLITHQLEEQQNNVYPTYHDILYWENKMYMHEMFDKLGVNSPKTTVYSNFADVIANETSFPFLIKIPHSSGSYGQFNVVDKEYLLSIVDNPIIKETSHYLVQERLNITMDMRVILVGDEIVHYYWRKNKDKSKYKTTSTSHGSTVDFEYFPEQWRDYILNSFKKLGIIMGAFDLGWQNDDLSNPPYFFEISPSYDINPKITDPEDLDNYGKWKKRVLFKGSFDKLFIEETYNMKSKAVKIFFEKIKSNQK